MRRKFLLLDNKLDDLTVGIDELRRVQGLHEGDEFEVLADHINDVFQKNAAARKPDLPAERSVTNTASALQTRSMKNEKVPQSALCVGVRHFTWLISDKDGIISPRAFQMRAAPVDNAGAS